MSERFIEIFTWTAIVIICTLTLGFVLLIGVTDWLADRKNKKKTP